MITVDKKGIRIQGEQEKCKERSGINVKQGNYERNNVNTRRPRREQGEFKGNKGKVLRTVEIQEGQ